MRLSATLQRAIGIVAGVILFAIFILNIVFAYQEQLIYYFVVVLLAAGAFVRVFRRVRIPERRFLILFLTLSVLIRIYLAVSMNTAPVSDFLRMFEAAGQVARGDFSFQKDPYFFFWSYQTGFVLFEALFIKLFGAHTAALLVVNALLATGTNLLIYGIVREITKETRAAMFGAALYLCYPAPYLLISVLTNQHLATFLILLGLYLLIRPKGQQHIRSLAAGVCVAFGNVIRPVGIVAVLSAMGYFLLLAVGRIRQKRPRTGSPDETLPTALRPAPRRASFWRRASEAPAPLAALSWAAVFLAGYLLSGAVVSGLIVSSGVNAQGLKNNDPYWKFVVGLNQETQGRYSGALVAKIAPFGTDTVKRYRVERALIADALARLPARLPAFLYEKNSRMWASYENVFWTFGEEASRNRSDRSHAFWRRVAGKLVKLDKCYYIALWCLALAGLVSVLVKRKINIRLCLFALVFTAYFMVHMAVEVQTRYRYFAMPLVCIMAAQFVTAKITPHHSA
jgi:hypothetical protein